MTTALQRAVKAVFDAASDHGPAPFYVYVESATLAPHLSSFNDGGAAHSAFAEEASADAAYAALFDTKGDAWPDPTAQHAPHHREEVAVAGKQNPLDALADELFWQRNPSLRGYLPNPNDPDDAVAIAEWRSIRAQVQRDPQRWADVAAAPVPPTRTAGAATEYIPPDPWASTDAAPAGPPLPTDFDQPQSLNAQTDQMFHAAHPELYDERTGSYRRLDPRRDRALVREWHAMRADIVEQTRRIEAEAARHRSPGASIADASRLVSSGDPTMNSRDPWSIMQGVPPGDRMIVPRQTHAAVLGRFGYGHSSFVRQGWGKYRPYRKGVLLDIAPVLHPVQDVRVDITELDPQNVLHVAITVDKRSYRAAVDLNKALKTVVHKLAKWHKREHARMGRKPLVGGDPSGAIDAAVGSAATALVGKMLDDHVAAVCGGWLDSIGSALSATVNALKGPITAAATAAAASIPGVGPMVAQLVPTLVNAAAGSPHAQAQVQQVKMAAAQNPQQAQALAQAQRVVAHSTTAAHVAVTTRAAQAGDPAAQQQLQQAQQAAQQGDPAAQQMTQLAQTAQQNPQASPSQLLQQLLGALGVNVQREFAQPPPDNGSVAGPVDPDAIEIDAPPMSIDQLTDQRFYAAHPELYDARTRQYRRLAKPPAPRADGRLALDRDAGLRQEWLAYRNVVLNEQAAAGNPDAQVVGDAEALVGAAVGELRKQAIHAAQQSHATSAVGVVIADHGMSSVNFDSADDADDWLGRLPGGSFIYAAYFDVHDPTWPDPLNERVGAVVKSTPGATASVQGAPILPALLGLGLGAGGMAAWDRRDAIRAWFGGKAA